MKGVSGRNGNIIKGQGSHAMHLCYVITSKSQGGVEDRIGVAGDSFEVREKISCQWLEMAFEPAYQLYRSAHTGQVLLHHIYGNSGHRSKDQTSGSYQMLK
jgi:hypothetical protein